jgi:hypothetical protein
MYGVSRDYRGGACSSTSEGVCTGAARSANKTLHPLIKFGSPLFIRI